MRAVPLGVGDVGANHHFVKVGDSLCALIRQKGYVEFDEILDRVEHSQHQRRDFAAHQLDVIDLPSQGPHLLFLRGDQVADLLVVNAQCVDTLKNDSILGGEPVGVIADLVDPHLALGASSLTSMRWATS